MVFELGVLFAVASVVFWGFGDFLIQRSAKKICDWETIFIICITGIIVLMPFVYSDLGAVLAGDSTFLILFGVSVVLLLASLFHFESMKRGKIAVVESVMTMEVPVTILFAFFLINESIDYAGIALIVAMLIGLFMISTKPHHFSRKAWLEKGVFLALLGAVLMGASNFFVGLASRITNPLLTVWFVDIVGAAVCLFYLLANDRFGRMARDMKNSKRALLQVSLLDNFGWIAFALAATLIPIGIAVALSESYIALAAVLGLLINKEILLRYQKIGLVISVVSAIALAALYA